MNRNKLFIGFAGLVFVAALAVTAQAAKPTSCPGGYDLVSIQAAADPTEARIVDKAGNHNKLVCEPRGNGSTIDDTP